MLKAAWIYIVHTKVQENAEVLYIYITEKEETLNIRDHFLSPLNYCFVWKLESEMFNASNDGREVENCYRSYIVTKPTTSYIINSIVGCIVNLILFFVGSFLNALVAYVFWKTPKLRSKVSYFMIMILSSIDILVTLIVHPAHLVMSIAEIVGKANCVYKTFYHIAAVFLSGMSFLTFFVMNIERYLSIVHPFFHLQHVTKSRCFVACTMIWSIAIFCGPVAYPLHLNVQFVITFAALIVMFGTCYIYMVIFYVARKRKRAMQSKDKKKDRDLNVLLVEDSAPTDTTTSDSAPHKPPDTEYRTSNPENFNKDNHSKTLDAQNASKRDKAGNNSKKTISFLHDLQLAKMYLLVVFCSFILNLPNALGLAFFHDRLKIVNPLVQCKIWTVTLVLMNSTINCLIFFWANAKLRKEGWKVCKSLLRRR